MSAVNSTQRQTNLQKEGYTILEGFAEPMHSLLTVWRALNQTDSFSSINFNKSRLFMLFTLAGEDALEEELARCLKNHTCSVNVQPTDKPNGDQVIVRYMSTNRLLRSYMEKGESRDNFAKGRAALLVWLGMIGDRISFYIAEKEEIYLSVTADRNLLTDRECPDQTGHSYFEVREGRIRKFVVLTSGSEAIYPLFCPA